MSPLAFIHWLIFLCQLQHIVSFRVMESLPVKSNAQNKNNQQQFANIMPPLPINTSWAGPLLESSGKAVRNLNHPLWYDDHNPTARKVTYLDSDQYGVDYHYSGFAVDWNVETASETSSLEGGRRRPLAGVWRRMKQWRRQLPTKPPAEY